MRLMVFRWNKNIARCSVRSLLVLLFFFWSFRRRNCCSRRRAATDEGGSRRVEKFVVDPDGPVNAEDADAVHEGELGQHRDAPHCGIEQAHGRVVLGKVAGRVREERRDDQEQAPERRRARRRLELFPNRERRHLALLIVQAPLQPVHVHERQDHVQRVRYSPANGEIPLRYQKGEPLKQAQQRQVPHVVMERRRVVVVRRQPDVAPHPIHLERKQVVRIPVQAGIRPGNVPAVEPPPRRRRERRRRRYRRRGFRGCRSGGGGARRRRRRLVKMVVVMLVVVRVIS